MTCAKQEVKATLIAKDGSVFVGTNGCANPQSVCPRGDMPTGVGYHLCKDICQQGAHAEIDVIEKAGVQAIGGWIFLEGHTYFCDDCLDAMQKAGVESWFIL